LVNLVTLDGGDTVANPFDGFGVGTVFKGLDYSNASRDYAYIYAVIENQTSSSTPAGDPGFVSQLRFYTNSGGASSALPTQKMVINAAGNVGIGVTSPAAKLDVRTDTGVLIKGASGATNGKLSFLPASGGRQYDFRNDGSSFVIQDASAGTNRMYFHYNGNVGIGTTSPSSKLNIAGLNSGYFVDLTSSGPGGSRAIRFIDGGTPTKYNWLVGAQHNVDNAFEITASTAVGGTTFNSPLFLVNQSGNVGIGTTSPGEKLEVAGNVGVNGFITHNGDSGTFMGWSADDTNVFYTAGNERLRIDSSGNVGIGTASPSAKLEIVTAVGADAIRLNFAQSADIFLGFNSANPRILLQDNSNVVTHNFQSNGDNYIVGSNVGIGTTSPGNSPLSIHFNDSYGSYGPTKPVAITNETTTGQAGFLQLRARYNNTNNTFYQVGGMGGGKETALGDGGWGGYLSFWTTSDGSAGAASGMFEHMRITADGNVGIGTTSPGSRLEIYGTDGSRTHFNEGLRVTRETVPAQYGMFNYNGGALNMIAVNTAGTGSTTKFMRSGNGTSLNTSMVIDTNGNIGIATTAPYSVLDVDGVITNRTASEDPNFTVTGVGMSAQNSGSLQFTQGFAGSSSPGDTVVFRYNAVSWKSWSLDYTFASTNGMVKGTVGGYNNNSGGGSNVFLKNDFGITCVGTNVGQNVVVTFTGNFGIHMMCDMRYSQGGGDGSPRADRASLTYNS